MNISETDSPLIIETEPAPANPSPVGALSGPGLPAAAISPPPATQPDNIDSLPPRRSRREFLWLAATFAAGLGSGYALRDWSLPGPSGSIAAATTAVKPTPTTEPAAPMVQIILPDEYALPVTYGDLGPRLLKAGAIDYELFTQVYREAGQPLTPVQLAILTDGSDQPVVFNQDTAYFLLNFFWAAGLANRNPILTEGAMMQDGVEQVGNFASTGGWTVGAKPATDLYAGAALFNLTTGQQARLEEVAAGVYRPCCNNSTAFPDCNHGMAMLGVLELMASQAATADEMFTAAKYINAFWFPQQAYKIAAVFKLANGQDFVQADSRVMAGPQFSSGSGFKAVNQWLSENGRLEQAPGGGNSCGV